LGFVVDTEPLTITINQIGTDSCWFCYFHFTVQGLYQLSELVGEPNGESIVLRTTAIGHVNPHYHCIT
jgi:hypothetical protein